jgi:ERCC4-related helicase
MWVQLHELHVSAASDDSVGHPLGFRVLALTATPGRKADAVQQVLANCYISKVEVRTEQDDDVKAYLPNKEVRLETVKMSQELLTICDMLRAIITPVTNRLLCKNAIQHYQGGFNPFILKCAQLKFTSSVPAHLSKQERQQILGDFCAAYFLKCQLWDIERNSVAVPLKKLQDCSKTFGTLANIRQRPDFKNVVDVLHKYALERNGLHPKLVALENLMIRHFDEYNRSNAECLQRSGGTRVMVFASGRDWVEEIVSRLTSTGNSVVTAAAFIGQAAGKTDAKTGVKTKGQTQKEQQAVLEAFRKGTVNTLICTCIGEEGLDVGEVDLIIHYDTVSSAIRNIQRSGRTGRKRAGRVVQLLMEGQEESEHLQNTKRQSEMEKTLKRLSQGRKLSMYPNDKNFLPRTPKVLDAEFDIPHIIVSSAKKTALKSRRRRVHGLSTQEHQWLQTHGYGERQTEDGASEGQEDEQESELSLHRYPESQVVPTSTYRVDHNSLSQHFVAIMLRLNGSRSGTYEAEREAYSKWQGPDLSLSQGSEIVQASDSGRLSQCSALQKSVNHRSGGRAKLGSQNIVRRRPAIIDEEEESDDAEDGDEEHLLDEDKASEMGDGADGLEDLELEDVDMILAQCSRVDVDEQLDGLIDQKTLVPEDECEDVDSNDDLFAAYNGKSMFGASAEIGGAAVAAASVEEGSRSKHMPGGTRLLIQGNAQSERSRGCGGQEVSLEREMKIDSEQGTAAENGHAETAWDDLEMIEETLPPEEVETFTRDKCKADDEGRGMEGPVEQEAAERERKLQAMGEEKRAWGKKLREEMEEQQHREREEQEKIERENQLEIEDRQRMALVQSEKRMAEERIAKQKEWERKVQQEQDRKAKEQREREERDGEECVEHQHKQRDKEARVKESAKALEMGVRGLGDTNRAWVVENETRNECARGREHGNEREHERGREEKKAARNRDQDREMDCKRTRDGVRERQNEYDRAVEKAGKEETASDVREHEEEIQGARSNDKEGGRMVREEHTPEMMTQKSSEIDMVGKQGTTTDRSTVVVIEQDAEAAGISAFDLDSIFPMMDEGPGKNARAYECASTRMREHPHSARGLESCIFRCMCSRASM